MPQDTVIRVENLEAAYGGNIVFQRVSLSVSRGEILGILGGSGSGKSTLLKHMIGLYRPVSGRILIEGQDLVAASREARRRILRSFGVMYQSGALFGSMDLLENVMLPMEEFTTLDPPARRLLGRMKLRLVGLEGFDLYLPSELSGGMQKRAAIARAMALDPTILFLDEPSAGLDPVTSAGLDQLILELRASLGITFVVVTHELPSIYTIADRVVVLDKRVRGIVAEGPPAELRDRATDPWVRSFFRREVVST